MEINALKLIQNVMIQILNYLLLFKNITYPMSLHCAFLFPHHQFKLIHLNTVGYISDNVFYRLNMATQQTQVQQNTRGRSYQAFTANHKHGIIVLVDYGKNPVFTFEYLHHKQNSFTLKDVCMLEIECLQLSLDGRYLAVACGVPEKKIIIVDVEKRKVLEGEESFVNIMDRKVKKIEFNPGNNRMFAVMYEKNIQTYEISDDFKITASNTLSENIKIKKKEELFCEQQEKFETFIWDQINNLYVSNAKTVLVYSTDTEEVIINYDLEGDFQDQVISSLVLTQKHLLLFYKNGRIQWINKYYPDLMEEQEIENKPFYLDKFYECPNHINWAIYDHLFTNIYIANSNGFFTVLPKAGESNQVDEEDQQNKNQIQKKKGDKKLQIQAKQLGPYHVNSIIFCRQVKGSSLLMTISKSGRVILWSTIQKSPITFYDTGLDIISADVNSEFNVLVTSHVKGIVQFHSIADVQNIYLFKEFKLLQTGIVNQVLFSSNCKEVAALSIQKKRVFYILTDVGQQFEVLGYMNLPYAPVTMAWDKTTKTPIKPKFQHLLVGIGFGILMINGPQAVSLKNRKSNLELHCDIFASRTDLNQKQITVLPTGQIITTGADKFLKKYRQPEQSISKFNPQGKTPVHPPLQELEAHDLQTTFLNTGTKYFFSGSQDGTIQVRKIDNFSEITTIRAHGWKDSNFSKGYASEQVDGLWFSCGKDGIVSIWKKGNIEIGLSDAVKKEKINYEKILSQKQNLKFYEEVIESEYFEKMKEEINKKKKAKVERIFKIKTDLKELLQENEGHEQLQRLERDEFIIDIESRDKVAKIGEQKCEKIKKESAYKVLQNEVYTKKLKELTWDRMQEHLKGINGLKYNYVVYNYQIRKMSRDERRKIQIIMDLRRAQLKEVKKRGNQIIDTQFFKNRNVINGGVLQPLILTVFEKKDDKKQEKAKKKKEEEVVEKQPQELQEIQKSEDWSLLYSSFELYSDNAKINQIILMKNVVFKIKEVFNKEFNKLLKYRQNQNQIINDKNKRIIQICEQLKRANEIIIGKKNILQNPDNILQVDEKQIPFSRYLSREQRQKLQKQRLKEQQRLKKLAEDDSSQRALQKMMGGTLEQKKTSVLQVNVERQKWMDKPIEEMTEQEKIKLKEYEQKKQKAEEEKERIVKKLEAELRKLKQQIDDIMQKYDERLFTLLRRRIQYDLRIEEQELYCVKLTLSMASVKQQSRHYQILSSKVQKFYQKYQALQNFRDQLREQQQEIEKQKQTKKAALDMRRLGDMQTKLKTIEKSVFEEYQNNLKKRRQIEEKILEKDKVARLQIVELDPLKQIESKNLSQQTSTNFRFFLPEIKELQQTFDFPDSLINVLENRFNIRKEEIEIDRKLKGVRDSIEKAESEFVEIQKDENRERRQLEQIKEYLQKSKTDLELQCRIKQGQVQINNETPVPKLDDALLISKGEIDEKNSNIIEKAQLKIDVMGQIKTCKISVTEQTLNLQRKQGLIDELSSMIKEVQMLKVKKEMQTALSKKNTKINENEMRSLKEQIEKVRKEGQKRISLFEKKIQKILVQIDSIKKQNKQLEVQKWNLQNTVKQREKIKEMMVGENGEGNQEAAEKFEQISINRKLFDKAKQQTEEIELLREQLSKLKAKTFANFSNVQR